MQEQINENEDYINTIQQLKENTVEKSKYDKLKEENKRLLDNVLNGATATSQEVVEAKESIEDLRKKMLDPDASNLQVATNALKLRDRLIEEGQPDPFLPVGLQITNDNEDIKCAEKVADVLKECVEVAEGDSNIFTNELMRRTTDVRI